LYGVEKPLLHDLGQTEGVERATDADVLVVHALRGREGALILSLQDFRPKNRGKESTTRR